MKNFCNINVKKIVLLVICFVCINISCCYAKTNSYIQTDTYNFKAGAVINSGAYIKIFLGNVNATDYSKSNVTIYPLPSEYETDDYGNTIARFTINRDYRDSEFAITINKFTVTDVKISNITGGNCNLKNAKQYLKSENMIESNNAFIISKANELTKDCVDDYEKIKNIYAFVNTYLTYDMSTIYRNKGALSALTTGRGVCEEYATLFVALCRAVDVPARIITGYNAENVNSTESVDAATIYHAWPEVYFEGEGWIPLEITAEYYQNNEKAVYWNGFLQLANPVYLVEGIYNDTNNEIEWYGVDFIDYKKEIKLVKSEYFSDVNTHWAKDHIQKMYDKKVINGYEDGTFGPDKSVSTIEFMAMLARTLDYLKMTYYSIDESGIYYPDDFVNNWSKADYDKLMKFYAFYGNDYQMGAGFKTLNHVFGKRLGMDDKITREKVVALIAPFLRDVDSDETVLTDIDVSKFREEIIQSYENGVITGYEDGTFKPEQTITRAEIATIFDRLSDKGI